MASQSAIEDRDAIYYPYIHIRDEAWLRSALLFFPHVLRMVPGGYTLNDSEFVAELAATQGRWGAPLVGSYPLDSPEAYGAGVRLAVRFAPDLADPAFRERYSRVSTLAQYGDDSLFQIHHSKLAVPLRDALSKAELIWAPSLHGRPLNRDDWLAVHPAIGNVIMSTAAATAACEKGCDVLTPSQRNHIVTASRDEDVIYATLLGKSGAGAVERKPDIVEIGNLVVATTLDLSQLTAANYAALSQDTGALFDLRQLLADRAAIIPAMSDPIEREKRAREAAEQIVEQWEKKRRRFKGFLRKLFRVDAAEPAKDAATDLLKLALPTTAAAGGAGATAAAAAGGLTVLGGAALAAAPGLAVGFVLYGWNTWSDLRKEEADAPTRFLSRVAELGGVLAAASPPSSKA